ncbi:trypsin inhibitor [Coccinella septempunctata]|uniref:trypsin inhibitor n=1 Tax=Coccinella septempunctata TaxID=41139 RepID=UPI001D05F961|nr:trypsin inhibitor [Coccinella septempunctata]XP_044760734.1 trypsin inhibitor [Coccinella septempunctata]XP_044760735.1 trypsin inhibitor [Coccinella septempunctata]
MRNFYLSMMLVWIMFHLSSTAFTRSDCNKPVEKGPIYCKAALVVYSWRGGKCQEAIYGGCFPSANNFQTLEQCQKVAGKICK